MQNHCEQRVSSEADVIPALAKFIGDHYKEEFIEARVTVQEMFNDIMDSESGDSLVYRQRMLATLSILQDFAEVVEPFTQDQLNNVASHE
jgi:hypothetical protein